MRTKYIRTYSRRLFTQAFDQYRADMKQLGMNRQIQCSRITPNFSMSLEPCDDGRTLYAIQWNRRGPLNCPVRSLSTRVLVLPR